MAQLQLLESTKKRSMYDLTSAGAVGPAGLGLPLTKMHSVAVVGQRNSQDSLSSYYSSRMSTPSPASSVLSTPVGSVAPLIGRPKFPQSYPHDVDVQILAQAPVGGLKVPTNYRIKNMSTDEADTGSPYGVGLGVNLDSNQSSPTATDSISAYEAHARTHFECSFDADDERDNQEDEEHTVISIDLGNVVKGLRPSLPPKDSLSDPDLQVDLFSCCRPSRGISNGSTDSEIGGVFMNQFSTLVPPKGSAHLKSLPDVQQIDPLLTAAFGPSCQPLSNSSFLEVAAKLDQFNQQAYTRRQHIDVGGAPGNSFLASQVVGSEVSDSLSTPNSHMTSRTNSSSKHGSSSKRGNSSSSPARLARVVSYSGFTNTGSTFSATNSVGVNNSAGGNGSSGLWQLSSEFDYLFRLFADRAVLNIVSRALRTNSNSF
jgi:hypothetical protein